jgi:hypothetical protein
MRASLEPVLTVAPRPTDPHVSRYVRSYLIMRVVIGAIGVALPFMLVLVDGLWFDDDPFPRTSLSAYYYSGVRELLVGTLTGLPADVVQLTPLQDRLGAANVERIHYIAAAAFISRLPSSATSSESAKARAPPRKESAAHGGSGGSTTGGARVRSEWRSGGSP